MTDHRASDFVTSEGVTRAFKPNGFGVGSGEQRLRECQPDDKAPLAQVGANAE